jgi:hypothetical protein
VSFGFRSVAMALVFAALLPLAPRSVRAQPVAVEAFVRGEYYHGISYAMGHQFGAADVPVLLRMLDDPAEKPYWPNILTVLGMIGDPSATGPLIRFLERRFTGDIDDETWTALRQVQISLGYLAHDPQSAAFPYLRDGTTRQAWQTRALTWTHRSLRDSGERENELMQLAVMGLGVAGTKEAQAHLRQLRDSLRDDRRLYVLLSPMIADALATNERIMRLGYERAITEH